MMMYYGVLWKDTVALKSVIPSMSEEKADKKYQ